MSNFAVLYDLNDLKVKARDHLLRNFDQVSEVGEVGLLKEEELVEILKSDEVSVESEDAMFVALQKWVKVDIERESRFADLLRYIRLPFFTKEFLDKVFMDEDLVHKKECREILKDATMLQFGSKDASKKFQRRCGFLKEVIMIGDTNGDMWWLDDEEWRPLEGIPKKLQWSHACATPHGLLVSGGSDGINDKPDVFLYETKKKSWTTLPSPSCGRHQHSSLFHKGCVYVVGGYSGDAYRNISEKFDFASRKWVHLPSLPEFGCFLAVSINDRLFVTSTESRKVFVLSKDETFWESRSDMPDVCKRGCCVVFKGELFIFKGTSGSSMRYNPVTDQWSTISPPPSPRHYPAALVHDNRILLIGGENSTSIDKYDPVSDTWSKCNMVSPTSDAMTFACKILL